MDRLIAHARLTATAPREAFTLAALTLSTMVLSSMDQCTRGPSLTCMLLSNIDKVI